MDDGWNKLGDSAVDGGLLFLIAIVVQMFTDLGRRVGCLIRGREKPSTRR